MRLVSRTRIAKVTALASANAGQAGLDARCVATLAHAGGRSESVAGRCERRHPRELRDGHAPHDPDAAVEMGDMAPFGEKYGAAALAAAREAVEIPSRGGGGAPRRVPA